MELKQCQKCGGCKFSHDEILAAFICERCSAQHLDKDWVRVLKDKSDVENNKKIVDLLQKIWHHRKKALALAICALIIAVANFWLTHGENLIPDRARANEFGDYLPRQLQASSASSVYFSELIEANEVYYTTEFPYYPNIRPMPTGFIFEIRFRLNDGTDRVNMQRLNADQELTANKLFLIWDDERGKYVADTNKIDRFDMNRTTRIERVAWTPIRQLYISYYHEEPSLSLQVGDTIRDLWYSPDFHHFFVRGAGFDYILNVYAYWAWGQKSLEHFAELIEANDLYSTTESSYYPNIRPMPVGFSFDIRFRLNDGTDRVNIQWLEAVQNLFNKILMNAKITI